MSTGCRYHLCSKLFSHSFFTRMIITSLLFFFWRNRNIPSNLFEQPQNIQSWPLHSHVQYKTYHIYKKPSKYQECAHLPPIAFSHFQLDVLHGTVIIIIINHPWHCCASRVLSGPGISAACRSAATSSFFIVSQGCIHGRDMHLPRLTDTQRSRTQ